MAFSLNPFALVRRLRGRKIDMSDEAQKFRLWQFTVAFLSLTSLFLAGLSAYIVVYQLDPESVCAVAIEVVEDIGSEEDEKATSIRCLEMVIDVLGKALLLALFAITLSYLVWAWIARRARVSASTPWGSLLVGHQDDPADAFAKMVDSAVERRMAADWRPDGGQMDAGPMPGLDGDDPADSGMRPPPDQE